MRQLHQVRKPQELEVSKHDQAVLADEIYSGDGGFSSAMLLLPITLRDVQH